MAKEITTPKIPIPGNGGNWFVIILVAIRVALEYFNAPDTAIQGAQELMLWLGGMVIGGKTVNNVTKKLKSTGG